MTQRHAITPEVANDALADPDRVVIDPDYNSTSGRSVRIIGFSVIAEQIVTVIVLDDDRGRVRRERLGANGKDRRLYNEQDEGRTR